MCASTGTNVWLMKDETSVSAYDSASSRAQAPQAGAALKSSNKCLFLVFASASAASTSVFHWTAITFTSGKLFALILVHTELDEV